MKKTQPGELRQSVIRPVGVAAYAAEERFAWQSALRRLGASTHAQSIGETLPLLDLDLWVVVLSNDLLLTKSRHWLDQLNTRALLISPNGNLAMRVSEAVRYPVLICSPAAAWQTLPVYIDMLLEISSGRVVIHGGMLAPL